MNHQLEFTERKIYQTTEVGIAIPFSLQSGKNIVEGYGKVDSGAEFCLFQRDYADELGLDIESGRGLRLSTLTGSFIAYGHRIIIQTFDLAFESTVYFAEFYGLNRSILGRNGWMEHLDIGLSIRRSEIYLGLSSK